MTAISTVRFQCEQASVGYHCHSLNSFIPLSAERLLVAYGAGYFYPVLAMLTQAVAAGNVVDLDAAYDILHRSETNSLSLDEYAAMQVIEGLRRLVSLREFPARSNREWERCFYDGAYDLRPYPVFAELQAAVTERDLPTRWSDFIPYGPFDPVKEERVERETRRLMRLAQKYTALRTLATPT